MANIKLGDEKGEKIVPLRERAFYIFLTLIFCAPAVILSIKQIDSYVLGFIWVICAACTAGMLFKLTIFSSYFIVFSGRIEAYDCPFFATNKFLWKKIDLIQYNNNIFIEEIENIELVRLTREERKKYLGFKYPFSKFMKFNIKNGRPKYICVGQYTKKEINRMLTLVNSKMSNVS